MRTYAIAMSIFAFTALGAQTCQMCDEIREYNRNHPENNYEYYDDYLKDQASKQNKTTEKKRDDKDAQEKLG